MPALGGFVVAFAVYPIASALFRQADLPKRLILGTIALGAFTFTVTALPGTPAIYADIFVVAVPIPVLALAAVVTLGTLFGSF